MSADELFDVAMGILGLGERQRVRLFVRRDPLDRFVECLVTIPRDRFNTENRERVGAILLEAFGGSHLDWTLQLSESVLARVLYIVHCPDGVPERYDVAEIEARLASVTRAWTDDLRATLIDDKGEERGVKLYRRYEGAFPAAYRSDWPARSAVADIDRVEQLAQGKGPIMSLYRPLEAQVGTLRCKLFSSGGVSLSDVLPMFEHMGAKVVDERPYEITPVDGSSAWMYDFGLRCAAEDVERVRDIFQDAFLAARRGELEDDALNGLVLARRSDGPRDHRRARGRQVPAPGRNRVLGRVHGADAARPRRHRGAARQAVRREVRSRCPRRRRGRATEDRDRGGDRRGREPRRGPDPAQLPVGRPRDAADQLLRRRRSRLAAAVPVVQARPAARSRSSRCRARSSRSSCTRRAWRACTCAAAGSPGAGCAGRTAARTSAPRSSA